MKRHLIKLVVFLVLGAIVNAAVTLALAGLWIANRRRQSYVFVFLWHLLASVWLASYAFPYYGELP